MYKIHIKLGENTQIFTTAAYEIKEGRIYFTDKFEQSKNFSASPETLIGIEEVKK